MKQPPFLKPGDKVALIASARKVTADEIRPAKMILKDWGLEPIVGEHIFEEENQFAGSDINRAKDLQWALDAEDIKAVFFARGGYGTIRLMDKINFSGFQKHPKWITGYSDITVLHQHINQNFGIATLHSTMLVTFDKDPVALESLRKALFGETIEFSIEPHPLNVSGEAKAEIVGGNLSLCYALCGSESDIDTKGKLLFLEDLDEYLYHIDRMMMNLKRSGKLQHLAGLVIGGMTDMKDNTIPFGKTAEEIIYDAVKQYGYPVCFNFPTGHIDKNHAIYLGKEVSLSVKANGVKLAY
ncbi:MAG: LD-carboxypeptidase [Bacteroidetes bacterium]|jgi:muramoyltetrapeptide carboxypeptidase|nr:LD-carboxypeptidase [Bacteroidota bacterium]